MSEFAPLFADSKGREVARPGFGVAIADTHAHLDMLDDPAGALARAARAGVGFIATVCDVTEDAERTFAELAGWRQAAAETLAEQGLGSVAVPEVRIIVGAHPHNAKAYDSAAEGALRTHAADPRTCAIGEIGLDYHYDHSPREVQRDAMRRHLALAQEFGLPVVIHLREAHDDGLAILHEVGVPDAGAILHCYTLDIHAMQPFLALGCHVSFAGPVTFKKLESLREACAAVPAGRILTETDCPFMAPEPFRGIKNEPAYVVFTAARMAEARGEDLDAFGTATYNAAVALLGVSRS